MTVLEIIERLEYCIKHLDSEAWAKYEDKFITKKDWKDTPKEATTFPEEKDDE